MATITPVSGVASGTALTYAAASAGGDTIAVGANPSVSLLVRNAGSSITVTLAGAINCSQGQLHNQVVTCPVGDTDILIPAHCVDSNGHCAVTYSGVTSVTIAAIIN